MIFRISLRLVFFLFLFIGLLALPHSVVSQGEVEVRITPENVQVTPNGTVDIAVEVVGVQDLYAFDISFEFNRDVVQVVDANPDLDGVQVALGTFVEPGFVLLNDADNAVGTLRFAMTQLNPTTPKSGTGTLIVIKLRGVQVNPSSALALQNVKLSSPAGVEIQSNPVDGEVEIISSQAGPTSTSMPAQDPGTPFPTRTSRPPTATPTYGPSPTPTSTFSAPTVTPTSTGTMLNPTPTHTAKGASTSTATLTTSTEPRKITSLDSTATRQFISTSEAGDSGEQSAESKASLFGPLAASNIWSICGLGLVLFAFLIAGTAYFFWKREQDSAKSTDGE